MVFLVQKPCRVKSEAGCLAWVISSASLISIPFLIVLINNPGCYDIMIYSGYLGILKMLGLVGLYYIIFTTYCLVVFCKVIKKLLNHKLMVNGRNPLTNAYMKKLVFRLCLYPLIPVIIWYPHIVVTILEALNNDLTTIYLVGIQGVIATLQGSLNFLFFLFDPALEEIWKEVKIKYLNFDNLEHLINLDKINIVDGNNNNNGLELSEEIEIVYNLDEQGANNKFKIV